MKKYEIYFIDKQNRLQSMLVCSLRRKIDWCEDGLKFVSWKYNFITSGNAENINDVFKKYSILNIDHRKKKQIRSINLGDIIVFDDTPWIVSAFGFSKIPDILWQKFFNK